MAVLRSAGITHVSLGNHEADLTLPVLKDRLGELGQRGRLVVLNSNVCGLGRHTKEFDVVSSQCGRIKVGLIGLLSDEPEMFRDGTFRGLQINNVRDRYGRMADKLNGNVNFVVPLTHQTIKADIKLANSILDKQFKSETGLAGGLVIGGHEHHQIHEKVYYQSSIKSSNESDNLPIHIVKTGQDAERVAIIDLQFEPSSLKLQNINVQFQELNDAHSSCPIVQRIVDKHLSALDHMKEFLVLDTNSMFSSYFADNQNGTKLPLSSEYSRFQQTTVGAFFCSAVKSELNVDVCIINGAPIKSSKVYANGKMSYDELKSELPFPLKMIVVEMTRRQLKTAIEYSRTNIEMGKPAEALPDGRVERRGYLQTDFEYWRQERSNLNKNDDEIISVALPRNLLKGFCKIQPLMELNNELQAKNALPGEDDYIKAVDLIVRFCCKDRWVNIAQEFSFDELDLNNDGVLCREELRNAIKKIIGEDPSEALLEGMIDAIDEDASGNIDEEEFNLVLAWLRRQNLDTSE